VRLRKYLENNYHEEQFKKAARELYSFLIKPLEHYLKSERIYQLIIAADGILQLIPFSSLMNQNQFLAESYAISIIPSITLVQPEKLPIDQMDIKAVLFGLSKGLPIVEEELKEINEILDCEMFMDENFSYQNILSALNHSENTIIHIATHGSFGNNPDERFLSLYDRRLQLNTLENLIRKRFFKKPLELLTLSACQTALGDDQTALGFAGISIKAGAKSVVATLWTIPDNDSTRILMKQFYRNLSNGMTKTNSLQMAKLFMINETIYKHPKYWSPFILIGSWL
jgi:CHAT domain-containing protein